MRGRSSVGREETCTSRDQLTRKVLGGGLQSLNYTYNDRGWLTSINQPLDRFADTDPMSACDQPVEGSSEIYCGGDDIDIETLNFMRFDENLRIDCYDPCEKTGGLVKSIDCNDVNPQSELQAALEAMEDHYTEEVEHICEDESQQVSARPVPDSLPYPATLCRVRLCDGTEAYVFEEEISQLTQGSYAILQEIEVMNPSQTFYVSNGTQQGEEVTLSALLGMVIAGQSFDVENYVQSEVPCEPKNKGCTAAEQAQQQASLVAIQAASENIDFKLQYRYPMKLYRVILCDGTETYLFNFELSQLYGRYTILQTIEISSYTQTFQLGGTVNSLDLSDLFFLGLQYDQQDGLNAQLSAPAQKNGNIAGMKWQVAGREVQAYGFQYDNLNRLKQAKYADLAPDGVYRLNDRYTVENIQYDAIGNIGTLSRYGVLPDAQNPGCFLEDKIDLLTYSYTGNRLMQVADAAPSGFADRGFKPGGSGSYSYDDNGNLTGDPYKGLTIAYNYLNLPETVTKSGGGSVTFSYDASGQKYRKVVTGTGAHTRDYVGGIEYLDQELEAIYHEEGRVAKDDQGNLRYEFTIHDHLGNSRVMFADLNNDGKIQLDDPATTEDNESEILQENHYYPFGMNMEGPWREPDMEAKVNRYQYNGKELNSDLGLGWNDYGARWYDAAVGRWNSVDPLASDFAAWSPYHYTYNNPIRFIDPDGKAADDFIIWYKDKDGNDQSFRFNGQNRSEAPKNGFVQQVIGAYNYNASNGGGCASQNAAGNPDVEINIVQTNQRSTSVEYGSGKDKRQFVYWVTNRGLQVENGDVLSPATILEHEVDHAYDMATNPNHYNEKKPMKGYSDTEEYRVITGSETETARANGEISPSKPQSRYSHGSDDLKNVETYGPTSNKIKKK